jgi:hypothetical protein
MGTPQEGGDINRSKSRSMGTPLEGGIIKRAQSPETMPVLLQAAGPSSFCSLFVAGARA